MKERLSEGVALVEWKRTGRLGGVEGAELEGAATQRTGEEGSSAKISAASVFHSS